MLWFALSPSWEEVTSLAGEAVPQCGYISWGNGPTVSTLSANTAMRALQRNIGCSLKDSLLPSGYAPITFTGAETTALILDYSFFFDLLLHGELPSSAERRRSEPDEMMEVVRVSFRPTDLQSGLILYSRTPTSEHTLEVSVNSQVDGVCTATISNPTPPLLVTLFLPSLLAFFVLGLVAGITHG